MPSSPIIKDVGTKHIVPVLLRLAAWHAEDMEIVTTAAHEIAKLRVTNTELRDKLKDIISLVELGDVELPLDLVEEAKAVLNTSRYE